MDLAVAVLVGPDVEWKGGDLVHVRDRLRMFAKVHEMDVALAGLAYLHFEIVHPTGPRAVRCGTGT